MTATRRIDPNVGDGDEVQVVFTPPFSPRQVVVGTFGASIDSRGGIDAIVVSGDGWAVFINPTNILSVRPADAV